MLELLLFSSPLISFSLLSSLSFSFPLIPSVLLFFLPLFSSFLPLPLLVRLLSSPSPISLHFSPLLLFLLFVFFLSLLLSSPPPLPHFLLSSLPPPPPLLLLSSLDRALLRDPELVSSLVQQNVKMACLLSTAGTDVFRRFTPESLAECERLKAEDDAERAQRKAQDIEIPEEELPKPSKDLEVGKSLPFIYGDPPPELLNIPLEELDPYYKAKKVSPGSSAHTVFLREAKK